MLINVCFYEACNLFDLVFLKIILGLVGSGERLGFGCVLRMAVCACFYCFEFCLLAF
jgi:hypothetical protein